MRFKYYSKRYPSEYIMCVHEEGSISIVQEIVKAFDPDIIVELGTSWGGFTLVLHDACPSAEIHSYDRPDPGRKVEKRNLFGDNVIFYNEDILSRKSDSITALLGRDARKLLYCDNGSKRKEIRMYAGDLKPGDMLGVHDWGTEVSMKHVEDILSWFLPVRHREFEEQGWSSRYWEKV